MKLVFATHNPGKFREVQLLVPAHIQLLSLADIGCREDIPETGATIAENALLKARYIMENYDHSCFADDTGLEVEALNGDPGIHTARYAGPQKDPEDNIRKLLKELHNSPNRNARFKTVIALVTTAGAQLFEGVVTGVITREKRGSGGFGYDPVFQPQGHSQTFAELPLSVKNKISHRAKAMQQLIAYLQESS